MYRSMARKIVSEARNCVERNCCASRKWTPQEAKAWKHRLKNLESENIYSDRKDKVRVTNLLLLLFLWLTLSENCQTTPWWYHKCANVYQKSTQLLQLQNMFFSIRIIPNFSNCGNWQLVAPNDFLWSSNSSSVPKVSTVPRIATLQQWVEFWRTARQTCAKIR